LRQGVEIRSEQHLYQGVLPIIWTGDKNHELDFDIFGQVGEFPFTTPFKESSRFEARVFLEDSEAQMYPALSSEEYDYNDPSDVGGFIEPFTIRARSLNIESDEAHTIKASVQSGNDELGGANMLVDRYVPGKQQVRGLFLDSGGAASGSVFPQPNIISFDQKLVESFDDSRPKKSALRFLSLGDDMKVAIMAMEGESTEEYVEFHELSGGTGSTFDFSIRGVDSIAFGGLKRS
jgi:hypothetical protein